MSRPSVDSGLPTVLQAIQYGDAWPVVNNLIAKYSIDVKVVGQALLLSTASSGNSDVAQQLIRLHRVPCSSCDINGRNILHISLLHKQFEYVVLICCEFHEQLLQGTDNKGFNFVHYLVMSKSTEVLRMFLYRNFSALRRMHDIRWQQIAALVDTENKRHGKSEMETITNTISPLDWAKRTKQIESAELLQTYMNQLRAHCLFESFTKGMRRKDDEKILREMVELTTQLAGLAVTIQDMVSFGDMRSLLLSIGRNLSMDGKLRSLTYLVRNWLAPLKAVSESIYWRLIEQLRSAAASGSEVQAFPIRKHEKFYKKDPLFLMYNSNRHFTSWDGRSPLHDTLRFAISEMTPKSDLEPKTSFAEAAADDYSKWNEVGVDYYKKMLLKMDGGVLVSERAAVLEYLMSLRPVSQQVILPLHEFVVQGQLHLLQWAVRAGHIDLKSPVGTCTSLVEHVHTLSWLTLEVQRKNKARSIPGDLTVAEVLCALAAGYGEFFIFRWLLEEVISPARHGVTFNHRDLLYIATSQNRMLVVKYLFLNKIIPQPQVYDACALAIETDSRRYLVCMVMLHRFESSGLSEDQWSELIRLAQQKDDFGWSLWANQEARRLLCAELEELATLGATDLIGHFARCQLTPPNRWRNLPSLLLNKEKDSNESPSKIGESATAGSTAAEGTTANKTASNIYQHQQQQMAVSTTISMNPQCVYLNEATSTEELLVWAAALAVRVRNHNLLQFIICRAQECAEALIQEWNTLDTIFQLATLVEELVLYARYLNHPKAEINFLTKLHNYALTYARNLQDKKEEEKALKSPYKEFMNLLHDAAPLEVLEACLRRQEAVVAATGVTDETEFGSMEFLRREGYNTFSTLAMDDKNVHIMKWLFEDKKVLLSYEDANELMHHAARWGAPLIMEYLVTILFLTPAEYRIPAVAGIVIGQQEIASFRRRVQQVVEYYMTGVKEKKQKDAEHIAVLRFMLEFGIRENMFECSPFVTSTDHKTEISTFKSVITASVASLAQQFGHPDMWALLEWMLTQSAFQNAPKNGAVLEMLLHYELNEGQKGAESLSDRSLRAVHLLLRHGARPVALDKIVGFYQEIDDVEHLPFWIQVADALQAHGVDIQRLLLHARRSANDDGAAKQAFSDASEQLESLKKSQRSRWALADAIINGQTVDQLKALVQGNHFTGLDAVCDRLGQNLLEVAALHDRGDVILWLHREHQMDIQAVNREGLSVLLLCRRAGSLGAAKVVADAIGGDTVRAFCWHHFHRHRALRAARAAQQQRVASAVKMQTCVRGRLMRNKYAPLLREVKGSWNAFLGKWGAVLTALKEINTQNLKPFSWAEQKFKYDMAVDVSEQDIEVQNFLDQAAASSVRLGALEPSGLEFSKITISGSDAPSSSTSQEDVTDPVDAVELSQAVVRWLDKADETCRSMFHKKVTRLAQGSRSYALSKRLKGCEYYICESKLDAGQRILWTYISRDDKQHVLVWFVSKHDNVSRCARLIDNACARTFRSVNRAVTNEANASSNSNQLLTLTEDSVLLDPSRNVPMKIYIAQRSELPLLAEKAWKAPLRLNQREQGVRSQTGTVLLLGRSGTGKTLCVMDRMNHDRAASLVLQRAASAPFKQLFVTRSSALCDFVRLYQQHNCAADDLVHTEYATFDSFLRQLESASTDNKADSTDQGANKKVDFLRFRDHVFPLLTIKAARTLDALVVWTQIRSFLKGSIEAALEGGVLSLATYLDTSKFSRDRCRLLPEQRQEVYALFVQYQVLHELHGWWDDMDRAMQVLRPNLSVLMQTQQLQVNGEERQDSTKIKYDKVYVDEVQDNTLVEIALYLVAVGGRVDALFLAGDPAQSVVEGVEFRFEEVRSLVYLLSQQQEALQRPTKLLVNYRSHSGILNCAGAVLGRMLAMFPGAAKTLPADEGLFLGPRPAFLSSNNTAADGELSDVRKLLAGNERLVVLCPDERAADVSTQLSASTVAASNLVLGIRAAKGLEFTDIVLLDFFSSIPDSDYKAWKELLAVGDESNHSHGHGHGYGGELQQYAFPQLEPQLKLLYTGITRCINRLIFVESRRSRIGGLFFRWLKQHGLADAFTLTASEVNVDGQQQHQQLMTRDEWRMRGIDIALSAEGAGGDLARSEQLLGQAAQCFQRAEEPALKAVAVAQAALYQAKLLYCNDSMISQVENVEVTELSDAEEVAVASAVLRGLRAGLQQPSQRLCHLLSERLEPQSKNFYLVELLRLCP